jgi:hypothetical protein
MEPTITADIVVAYSQCPRKAYLLLLTLPICDFSEHACAFHAYTP